MTILYEDLPVSVEDDPARCPEGEGALVIVLGQLLELGVLNDLENPEADDENGENGANGNGNANGANGNGNGAPH